MPAAANGRLSSGVDGLDTVLCGGFIPHRAYMVRGEPGVGKTALGLHFLAAGAARGERTLFLTSGATEEAIRQDAGSLGIAVDGIDFVDFTPSPDVFADLETYNVFSPVEVERETFASRLVSIVRERKPQRVFLDALTHARHLSSDVVDFRRQAHAFLRFLVAEGATVMFASGSSDLRSDEDLQFMSDGVVHLEYAVSGGGRIVAVTKLRGSRFRLGRHSLRIANDGVVVYPRLVPESYGREFVAETIPSEIPSLDSLLGGGIERGTVTLVTGPSGVGKTTLGAQFLKAAAARGERSVLYTFEESHGTILHRLEAIGTPIGAMIDEGSLALVEAEPLDYTPDQFALAVREEVEQRGARMVMLDSVAGYRLSIRGEDLVEQIHALCRYLKNMGVTVLLMYEMSSVTGDFQATEAGLSYLSDNIVFLRYVEIDSELRRVVGVLKKRMSDFEKGIRELTIDAAGISVGPPMSGFRGILRGIPEREAG
jgi:circadian clock protein KaiC